MTYHHPEDTLLMDYAAGNLSMAKALAVSVHLFFCRHCQGTLKKLNSVGGVLLEQQPPISMSEGSFEQLMEQLNKPSAPYKEVTSRNLHNPLSRYLPTDLEQISWHKQTRAISKYDLSHLMEGSGMQAALQKVKAGASIPRHTHRGEEFTVILQGGFSDELGVYHVGDFILRDASHNHRPTALQNEDCVCLTVLEAPIRFTQGWYRFLNPFMSH